MAKLKVNPSSHRSVRVYCIHIYIYPCYKVPTVQFWQFWPVPPMDADVYLSYTEHYCTLYSYTAVDCHRFRIGKVSAAAAF